VLGPPWWTALQDRDGSIGDVDLEADLVSGMFRHSSVGPPPDPIDRIVGDHEGSSGPGPPGPYPLRLDDGDATAEFVEHVGSREALDKARMLPGSRATGRRKTRIPAWLSGG
jgi:hypothetical protein